jgi:ankyrin repeat protein
MRARAMDSKLAWILSAIVLSSCAPLRAKTVQVDSAMESSLKKAWDADDPTYVDLIARLGRGPRWKDSSQDETYLHWAASSGKANIAGELIKRGADVHARMTNRDTPLHLAVYRGYVEVVKVLLKNGADPNKNGGEQPMGSSAPANMTPLHIAAGEKNLEIVKLLIAHGGDIEAKNFLGETPLYIALRNQRKATAEFLLTLNPEVNIIEGYEHKTPLMRAIFWGYFDIAKELLRRGAEVNLQETYEDNTPLHFAAKQKDRELVEMLLSKGADPTSKNRYGRTPAQEAEMAKNPEIAALILEAMKARKKP